MINSEDLNNKRTRIQENNANQSIKQTVDNGSSSRQQAFNTTPEILTNPIYTPAFLREQIGKLMRVEFLIGTNNLVDRIGFLEDVGASYILLRSFEGDSIIYADIYSIKFITISATYSPMQNFPSYNNFSNINSPSNPNINRYY